VADIILGSALCRAVPGSATFSGVPQARPDFQAEPAFLRLLCNAIIKLDLRLIFMPFVSVPEITQRTRCSTEYRIDDMISLTRHKGMVPLRGVQNVPQTLSRVSDALKNNGTRIIHCDVDSIQFEAVGAGSQWTQPVAMTEGTVRVELVGREPVLFYDVSLRWVFRVAIRMCAFVGVFGILFAAVFAAAGGLCGAALMLPMIAGMSVYMVVLSVIHAKYKVDAFFYNAALGRDL